MPTIIEIQVFYRDKSGESKAIHQAPSGQEISVIKLDTARIIKQIKQQGNAEYYYVVIKVRKSDGGFGYRTIVPKTLL